MQLKLGTHSHESSHSHRFADYCQPPASNHRPPSAKSRDSEQKVFRYVKNSLVFVTSNDSRYSLKFWTLTLQWTETLALMLQCSLQWLEPEPTGPVGPVGPFKTQDSTVKKDSRLSTVKWVESRLIEWQVTIEQTTINHVITVCTHTPVTVTESAIKTAGSEAQIQLFKVTHLTWEGCIWTHMTQALGQAASCFFFLIRCWQAGSLRKHGLLLIVMSVAQCQPSLLWRTIANLASKQANCKQAGLVWKMKTWVWCCWGFGFGVCSNCRTSLS